MNLAVIIEAKWINNQISDRTLFAFQKSYANYSCLKITTIFNFVKYPYNIRFKDDPEFSPTGNLPSLFFNQTFISGNDIIAHIANEGFDIDQHLSIENKADSRAFVALLESNLEFVLVIL
jgi:glutaredoxin-related protein